MSSRLDEILNALRSGQHTADEACRAVTAAVRANPAGTRMWSMLIESRITQGQLDAATGRKLIDAIEAPAAPEHEKTMWLAPARLDRHAETLTPTKGDVLKTPTSKTPPQPLFADAEQLRAFLWDSPSKSAAAPSKPSAQRGETNSTDATTDPVAWLDMPERRKRVVPPRPMPGIAPAIAAPDIGSVINKRYRLESHLGYGGIGQVFSATDLQRNSPVTLKLVAVDLKREPQALAALRAAVARVIPLEHPNIVRTLGIEQDGERAYVVMEALTGHWLGNQVRQIRKVGLPQEIAWPLIESIAVGLAYAHEQGVVHSDLSPYSVFITADGTPKIMGFGLIHAVPTSNEAMDLLDTMTLRAYSEAYTADTWATHATPMPSDDLYPLGVIAYELFTGKHPFGRHSLTTARQKNLSYEPIPDLNRRATKLLERCLSFERTDRLKNATRFVTRMHGPAWLKWLVGDRFSMASSGSEE